MRVSSINSVNYSQGLNNKKSDVAFKGKGKYLEKVMDSTFKDINNFGFTALAEKVLPDLEKVKKP